MRLFQQDDEVVLYETGFDEDLLERKKISKQLSDIIDKVEDPLVLALDDRWGSGKTFFLKRWVAAHTNENDGKAITVYFDAFESDYLSDPLVSIIQAVSDRIPSAEEDTLQNLKSVAIKLAKPTLGIALSLATFGAKRHLDEIGDAIAEAVGSEAKDLANDLWEQERQKKDAIQSFKDLLKKLTEDTGQAIVIVVDELDRCRPDYALAVLEIIKHFFAVPRVHFVLGVNGEALENSVMARYGANIDAKNYLKKFISVSFSFPRYLGPNRDVDSIVSYASRTSSKMGLPKDLSKRCIDFLAVLAQANNVSLRDVGKILSRIALVPAEVSERKLLQGWIDTLCVLIVSEVVDPNFHRKFVSGRSSLEEIMAFIGATRSNTSYEVDNEKNPEFDRNITVWLVVMVYTCCPEKLQQMDFLPPFTSQIGKQFDSFGAPYNPKSIAPTIQKDWVDLFKL